MTRLSNLYYSEMDTPLGMITLARTKKGLCWLEFNQGESVLHMLERWSRKHFLTDQMQQDDQALQDIRDQLDQYFAGQRKQFDCEIDLIGTPFQKLVWQALLEIPFGEYRSYKDIAQAIGAPKAVRAVGGANNKNNIPIIIPCHRVIGTNGSLVGYGGGLHIKEYLLNLEGTEYKAKKKA
ncbi:methylated-DNA--[protein]-cysteine S-methyltransferase [Caldalkalibacillus mannanilyticus]|uniref:methylated-DNA--[protein]-cysteine S-methyltransferase n=1 Tax=Caldalkalibacillus mannanilyticus TaxID=1418 RepID=UPI00054FE8F3|nr:methylated-DNA--[protein]-cysteine S-methyltransferase [Caldalkalibacillus mannanilyticus]